MPVTILQLLRDCDALATRGRVTALAVPAIPIFRNLSLSANEAVKHDQGAFD